MKSKGLPPEALAAVNVRLDRKMSDGNFGSVGISVGVTYPCRPEDVDKTYAAVLKWVKDKVKKEAGTIDGEV